MNLSVIYTDSLKQKENYTNIFDTSDKRNKDDFDVPIYKNRLKSNSSFIDKIEGFKSNIVYSYNETLKLQIENNNTNISNEARSILFSISEKSVLFRESIYKKPNNNTLDHKSFLYFYKFLNLYHNNSFSITRNNNDVTSKNLADFLIHSKKHTIPKKKFITSPIVSKRNNTFFSSQELFKIRLPERESTKKYYMDQSKCFKSGTDESKQNNSKTTCHCTTQWHGPSCSIPSSVYYSSELENIDDIIPRNFTKRIVNAIAFNVEFELLEARIHELNDVVDLFVIFESNYSNYGEKKPLRLLQKLKAGYLKEFHHKIFYLLRDFFPPGGKEDGWIVDYHMRNFIGKQSLKRVVSFHSDDLFIYTDADEIPSYKTLLFLKLHDGYPEPFGFTYRWSVFGFFWRQLEPTRLYAGCSIAMMKNVFEGNAADLRAGDIFSKFFEKIEAHIKTGHKVQEWHIGEQDIYAGWHCSWCLSPSRIRIKLVSAINADFPRWGNFPEKRDINYIRNLIKTGTWFDDVKKLDQYVERDTDNFYAPTYLIENEKVYKHLLDIHDV